MDTINIKSYQDLENLLSDPDKLLKTQRDQIKIVSDFIKPINIKITGEQYPSSSISSSIMRSFIILQDRIEKLYKIEKYGDTKKQLTEDEKRDLELIVKVSKGSSVYELITNAKGIFEEMTGGQALLGLLILSTAFVLPNIIGKFLNYKKFKSGQDSTNDLVKTCTENISTVANAMSAIVKEKIESIEINSKKYTCEELQESIKHQRIRTQYEPHNIQGQFIITHIELDSKKPSFINAVSSTTQELYKKIKIRRDDIASNDFQIIKGLNNGASVNMQIIVTKNEENKIKEIFFDKLLESKKK